MNTVERLSERRFGLLVAGLALALATPHFANVMRLWGSRSELFVVGVFAVLGAARLGYKHRPRSTDSPGRHQGIGCFVLLITALGLAESTVLDFMVGAGLSFTLLVASALYLGYGLARVRELRFALALLVLTTPPPGFLLEELSLQLLDWSRDAVVWVLPWLTGPIEVEGYYIFFETGSIVIVDDCSGLSGMLLFVPVILILVGGHLPMRGLYQLLLLSSAIPLAFIGNLLRILATGLFVHLDLTVLTSDWAHEVLGMTTLLLCILILVLLCRRLASSQPEEEGA